MRAVGPWRARGALRLRIAATWRYSSRGETSILGPAPLPALAQTELPYWRGVRTHLATLAEVGGFGTRTVGESEFEGPDALIGVVGIGSVDEAFGRRR